MAKRSATRRNSISEGFTIEQRLNLCRKWLRKNTDVHIDYSEGQKELAAMLAANYPFSDPESGRMATAVWVASNEIITSNRTWARKERQKAKRRDVGRAKPGGGECVYVVGPRDARYVKIGRSSNLRVRLQGLQTGFPEPLYVYHVFHTKDMDLEQALHRRFADYRTNGEWFAVEGDVADWLDEIGDPVPAKGW